MSRTEIRTQIAWLQSPALKHHAMLYLKIVINIYWKLTLGPCIILSPLHLISQLSFKKGLWHVMSCVCMISHIWLFATPWTVTHQAPLSMEFSREEYWSKLPFPPPGDLPWMEPMYVSFSHWGSPSHMYLECLTEEKSLWWEELFFVLIKKKECFELKF